MPYRRLLFRLPSDLEDLLVAELWLAGTQGVQSSSAPDGRLQVEAYFPAEPRPGGLDLPPEIDLESDEVLPDADWFAVWRERARPFPVGRTLLVDPREPDEEPVAVPEGRRLLRLPARAAFGTGSHESTSLALELLEDADVRGLRVLDVGTGTGVLAFATLLFGARFVVGFDVDPASPFHARDNSGLNNLRPLLFAGRLAALRERPLFDLALVNVVPEQILPEMPDLVRLLRPGGQAILSGILAERGRQVLNRMQSLGFVERDRREAGEWVAFRVGGRESSRAAVENSQGAPGSLRRRPGAIHESRGPLPSRPGVLHRGPEALPTLSGAFRDRAGLPGGRCGAVASGPGALFTCRGALRRRLRVLRGTGGAFRRPARVIHGGRQASRRSLRGLRRGVRSSGGLIE